MLSYRHAFHAGNFADVLKHLVLSNVLEYAMRKAAPLLYLDTHAGSGLYKLQSSEANQTGEMAAGIFSLNQEALFTKASEPAALALHCYFDQLKPFLDKQQYPGSPLLAASMLRRQDHLHFCELHPADFKTLHQHAQADRRITCEQLNGFQRALALLPPVQKRAVVLIDPSYELKDEYQQVTKSVNAIYQRMPSAQILVWYPVVNRHDSNQLLSSLSRKNIKDLWCVELGIAEDTQEYGMTGSGMVLINPPWTLPEQLKAVLPLLQQSLETGKGYWRVEQLSAE